MTIQAETIVAKNLDHHGIIAGLCQQLKLAEKIDQRIGQHDQRVVSAGTAVVSMILNGLGFTNNRLYLSHQFFKDKPVDLLLGEDLKAKDFSDDTLGHALDDIASYGESDLFAEIAFDIALEHNLLGRLNHLDSTSLSVDGEYKREDPGAINICHGHSKDHRPDLKQAVLSLVVNAPSSIPLFMEPLDGNSSDKSSFHETIRKVQLFKEGIELDTETKWIADSALYSKEKLLKDNDYLWVSRVPASIKAAQDILNQPDNEVKWKDWGENYKIATFPSDYGEIEQRWLLVFSEAAYKREAVTLERKLEKDSKKLTKQLWHLGNEVFNCEKDAKKALDEAQKQYPHFLIQETIVPIEKHATKGRPKKEATKKIVGYKLNTSFTRNEQSIQALLNSKGRFLLATNDLETQKYPDEQILSEYKDQQSVERGFRFIKDPWFMVDSIFLKSPKRIQALMMVMTLCLLVYNYGQYLLRENLKANDQTIPDQKNKPTQNPTLRWVIQLMQGITLFQIDHHQQQDREPVSMQIVVNLDDVRKQIIWLFGHHICRIYRLGNMQGIKHTLQ